MSMFLKLKKLSVFKRVKSGRNNQGRITSWHRSGGERSRVRFLNYSCDLFENKNLFYSQIGQERQRSSKTVLLGCDFGFFSYTFAPRQAVTHKDKLLMRLRNNSSKYISLRDIPLGTSICNIERKPFEGGRLCRSAGTYARLMYKKLIPNGIDLAGIVTRKKQTIYVPLDSRAFLGVLPNVGHRAEKWGSAGISRKRGIRPTVRGVAMNPVDHPHGGGENKSSGGRCSSTPWGKLTKGFKTIKRKKLLRYKLLISKMNKIL